MNWAALKGITGRFETKRALRGLRLGRGRPFPVNQWIQLNFALSRHDEHRVAPLSFHVLQTPACHTKPSCVISQSHDEPSNFLCAGERRICDFRVLGGCQSMSTPFSAPFLRVNSAAHSCTNTCSWTSSARTKS